MDQQDLAWFAQLNARLGEDLDDRMIRARLRANIDLLHDLAGTLAAGARSEVPAIDLGGLPGVPRQSLTLFQAAA
jgi:hypothetical protein